MDNFSPKVTQTEHLDKLEKVAEDANRTDEEVRSQILLTGFDNKEGFERLLHILKSHRPDLFNRYVGKEIPASWDEAMNEWTKHIAKLN